MAELSGNNSNQRGQDEHYKKTKKVTVYFYDTSNDVPVRVSSSNPLPTTATISGDVTVTGSAAYSDSGGVDKKGLVDADRHIQVDVLTSALPSGASTSATDTNTAAVSTNLGAKADASATTDTGSFSLISLFKRLLEKMTTLVAKDFSTETTLSALNTKVPASPATSGKQDTGNTSLSSIDGKITAVNTGAVVVSSSALPTGAATAANQQTNALTDTQLRATAVPVSGTVTANLSATDNAVLDDIALDTEAIKTSLAGTLTVTGGGGGVEYTEGDTDATIVGGAIMVEDAANTLQPLQGDKTNGLDVDVTRSALPTGAATSAKQDTIIGHVDGIEGSVDGIETLIGSTNTKLDTVITNTDAALTDTELRATAVPVSVSGVSTSAKQDTAQTSLDAIKTSVELSDDAVYASDAAISKVVGVGAQFDDTAPGTTTENSVRSLRMSTRRELYNQIRDAAGNERGANVTAGNALVVDGSASTQPVSGTFWQATQPVSGTVTANAGTNLNTSALALSATQTDKSQFTKITDGTDTALITASGEQNVLESNSAAIKTAVETIDNAVSGAGFNITQVGGTNIDTNSGNKSAGTQRVVLATDQPALTTAMPVSYATTGSGTATGALRVELPTNGTGVVGLNAGTNAIGKLAANSGVDIGDVDVTSAVSGTLDHGSNQDIDTAAEQITSTSFACKFGVTLRADIANTGTLYIGNSDVTVSGTAATDGIPLYPGDSLFLPVTNSNIPYAVASANNQKVFWVAV